MEGEKGEGGPSEKAEDVEGEYRGVNNDKVEWP